MSRSLSWIDRGDLTRSLSRIGLADTLPTREPRTNLTRFPAPAGTTLEPTPLPSPAPAEVEPPAPPRPAAPELREPSISERIDSLSQWLQSTTGGPFFVADPEGLPIATHQLDPSFVVSSVALARALRSLRGLTGTEHVRSVTLELDEARVLDTLWTDTPVGRVAVGLLNTESVGVAVLTEIRDAVRRAFDWESS